VTAKFVWPGAILLAVALVSFVTAVSSSGRNTVTINVTGSSTIAPLASELGKHFERSHPGVQVNVQTGGSSRGIADARQGLAEIGMVSRAATEAERDLKWFTIARDGIGVIVHRGNALSTISKRQLADIYTGRVKSWGALGGDDRPIIVVSKAEGRSTLELFLQFLDLSATHIKAHTIIGDNEQAIKQIAGSPDAIGYVSIGTAEYHMRAGTPVKLVQVEGREASSDAVAEGTYPMARPLSFVTLGPPRGEVLEFIEFARSKAAHATVSGLQLVPADE
jgi:phosphate transport system substrate-binding protein